MPAASDIRVVDLWRRDDAKVAADAVALWKRLGALPPEDAPEERAGQLCAAAYLGDELIGVSTATPGILPQLGVKFGVFRCLVAPEHRQRNVARSLTVHSRELLADWSRRNPEEQVLGMAAIVESPALDTLGKQPVWPASRLTLAGYAPNDLQIRIVWFDHARLGPAVEGGSLQPQKDSEASLVTLWQNRDPDAAGQAMALWDRLGVLPAGVSGRERAAQLCGAAFVGGALAGVSTVALGVLPQLKARFGFFRCLVVPEHRRRHLARQLAVHARQVLAGWSKANPREKVLGMVSVVENPRLAETSKLPVWSAPGIENGLLLVGHTLRGHQIRVSWFEHARLD